MILKIEKILSKLFSLIFMLIFSSQVFSQTKEEIQCSYVDLRNPSLGIVRNQGSIGWCYSFTAADLVSFKLGIKVSAADLAFQYTTEHVKSMNRIYERLRLMSGSVPDSKIDEAIIPYSTVFQGLREGGESLEAIYYSSKSGFCLEEDLPSENIDLDQAIQTIKHIEDDKNFVDMAAGKTNYPPCYQEGFNVIQQMFKNIHLDDYLEVLQKTLIENVPKMLADRTCKNRIQVENLNPQRLYGYDNKKKEELFSKLDSLLDKKTIVGITYDADILTGESTSDKSNHVSIIVGRRFNSSNNSCEYLIRNSWGSKCEGYVDDCQNGNIWMPKKKLDKSLNSITYIP
jgi:hypothetical protein